MSRTTLRGPVLPISTDLYVARVGRPPRRWGAQCHGALPARQEHMDMATRTQPEENFAIIGDELPENPKPKIDVTNQYKRVLDAMEKAQAPKVRGKWVEIRHYASKPGSEKNPGGARKAAAKLLSGDVTLPECEEGWGFDVEWRNAWYDGSDRQGTVLIVRYSPDPTD